MPKVFNIMQYCKHPITGEVLITEEQIKSLFDRRTIKLLAYILHDEEDFDEEDEENDLNRCKKEYEKLSEEEKKETSLEEYVKKNHWKKLGIRNHRIFMWFSERTEIQIWKQLRTGLEYRFSM